jgi:endonuclease YncB( thermonuclease family)
MMNLLTACQIVALLKIRRSGISYKSPTVVPYRYALKGLVSLLTVRALRTAAVMAALLLAAHALVACEAESSDPSPNDADAGTVDGTTEGQSTTARPASSQPDRRRRTVRVAEVLDGDTIDLRNGQRIRFVQIDAPESSGECYGIQAGLVLSKVLPQGTRVVLERDPALDNVDRYGRLLRYVRKGRANVNLVLVRRGAASVWFFDGDRGRYADRLLAAARRAKAENRGAWRACRARLDPSGSFDTFPKSLDQASRGIRGGGDCLAGYNPCLPIVGDLDCADVKRLGKAPVRVVGSDPYRLDVNDDGVGCE